VQGLHEKTSKKIRFFQKIGFLTEHRCQKNPIFSKNRIFNGASVSKKIRFFQKIGFLTGISVKKNPIFSKNRIFNGASIWLGGFILIC
jgi:hypothetical protein